MSVLEAAYHLDSDERTWLGALAESVRVLANSDAGTLAVIYEPEPAPFFVRNVAHATGPDTPKTDTVLEAFYDLESFAKLDPFAARTLHSITVCETSSEYVAASPNPEILDMLFGRKFHDLNVRDAFNIQGTDLAGRALCLMVPRSTTTSLSPTTRAVWRRVAVHLGAALRLRMSLAQQAETAPLDRAAAIFDGRTLACEDARGTAQETTVLANLREAVKAVDRARSRAVRQDAPQALELWRGLFAGRYSLADVFDSDGRRHIVVHENEPAVEADRRLTRRETQAALLAAAAHDDAHGAYALGVSRSTFRAHLRRGLRKLGVSDRAQLIEIADALRREEAE